MTINHFSLSPNITWPYFVGLMETDGTFKLNLDKHGTLKGVISFSQKTNKNLIGLVQEFLNSYGITSTIDTSDPEVTDRAPALRIQGPDQCLRFMQLLREQYPDDLPFFSQKYRDFLVMEVALSNRKNLSLAEKIDLLKSLHKSHRDEDDLVLNDTTVTRKQHETRLGLTPGASKGAAEGFLSAIDGQYEAYVSNVRNQMANNTLLVDERYMVAVIDGDGFFYVTTSWKPEGTPNYKKPHIIYQGNVSITMEKPAVLVNEVFKYYYQINVANKDVNHNKAIQVLVRSQPVVNRIVESCLRVHLLGDHVREQIALVQRLRAHMRDGLLTMKRENYETIKDFFFEIYRISAVSLKGKERDPATYEEAIKRIEDMLGM